MTENLDSTKSEPTADYLTESFVTEDGLVVPPPTREMGPRRLTRYHQEVTDFLRALRDGGQLPEEPIEFMGSLPEGEAGSETRAIYDRYIALSKEGAFAGSEATPVTTTVSENEHVFTSDDFIDSPKTEVFENSEVPAQEEVFTAEDLIDVAHGDSIEKAEEKSTVAVARTEPVQKIEEAPRSHSSLFADPAEAATQPAPTEYENFSPLAEVPVTPKSPATEYVSAVVKDQPESIVPAESVATKATESENQAVNQHQAEEPKATPNRFDLIRAKAAKARAVSTGSNGLPNPVSALDSEGIDFEPLNRAEERRAAQKSQEAAVTTEQTPVSSTESVTKEEAKNSVAESVLGLSNKSAATKPESDKPVKAQKETLAEEPQQSFSVAQAVAAKSKEEREAKEIDTLAKQSANESEFLTSNVPVRRRNSSTWIGLLSVLVIIALIFVWLMFFK